MKKSRAQGLGLVVGALARRISRALAQRTAPHGVMPAHFAVLRCLRDQGVSTQMELSRMGGIEQSSMAVTLMRMEKAGLIERTADYEDARRKLVRLTDRGVSMVDVMVEASVDVYDLASEGLTDKEVQEFMRIGRKMMQNLEQRR